MLARTRSYTTLGLDALPVDVEVDVAHGLPSLTIVGLPDQAVKEAKERVRAAIINSQYDLPSQRLTINLAPADVKKEGGVFDLAIALGVLAASGQCDPAALASVVALGELSLEGRVRPVPGALPIALALRSERRSARRRRADVGPRLLVPAANAAEAAIATGVELLPVSSLREAAEFLSGEHPIAPYRPGPKSRARAAREEVDFSDVNGQPHAKRALEVAVAGGHHVLLIGPPGSGKTMLAQRLHTIQPDLSLDEALETATIHSIAGLLNGEPLIRRRPFRAPHHTSSAVALVGGGSLPKPGEASLAHHGILFLDELPEFHRDVLESLRQPLEEGTVRIARVKRSLSFPARFTLIAAMNPCPCGYLTDAARRCRCTPRQITAYLAKISGPLLDRIDLHVEVPALPVETLTRSERGEPSVAIRARVMQARRRQRHRLAPLRIACNAQLRHKDLAAICPLTDEAKRLLASALHGLHLSARSYDKILRIARTIADLAGLEALQPSHVAEAIQYRSLDRQLWLDRR